jgi:hypothetical protein
LFRSILTLNPALPLWKMLASMFLPTIIGTSHCLVFFPLINTVLPFLCAYAANAVGKDLDIFALGTVSLNHIFTQQPKSVNNVCSYS